VLITVTALSKSNIVELLDHVDIDEKWFYLSQKVTSFNILSPGKVPPSATGISTPTLMGMVILQLTDDEGVTHSFEFTNGNYLPDSPVNFLSLR
jgi:hypothetical protein